MTRSMRLELFERELERLLRSEVEDDYVSFADAREPSRQVLFLAHDGAVYGEVLSAGRSVETALGCLGFEKAGRPLGQVAQVERLQVEMELARFGQRQ